MVAQLKELEHLDAETKARLAADLREVDQAFWPYVLLYYREKSASRAPAGEGVSPTRPQTPARVASDRGPQRVDDEAPPTPKRSVPVAPRPAPSAVPTATGPQAAVQPLAQRFASGLGDSGPGDSGLGPSGLGPSGLGPSGTAQLQALALSAAAAAADAPPAAPLGWREHLAAAIAELERQPPAAAGQAGSAQAANLEPKLRLLYLAADRGQDALRPCEGLSEQEQQFWSEELFGLATSLDPSVAPAERRYTLAARHLRQAALELGQQGLLDVRNAAFCSQVDSYGIYRRMNEGGDEFKAGQEVLLYAEVENFASQTQPDGFHTSLASRYEILDERGQIVARHEFAPLEETCRNQRRDYFIQHRMWIPKNLARGRYRLRLVLIDNHAHKQGEAHLPFAVRGA